ncbi:GNAT family N-acetyltransferase [Solirubrobacter sp. CPCC 204708]|uniref:GNAT family N-acetyltransferase n=1 Tax=Solirubrobacter deserti TaxID=2282478 RepID=A0ABT4RDS6_9ACTN|nr:GNAT family N-acetyltransferase [Solirubrobacter deserti]MBE2314665.1 GNAT family N-acetyltransferase [Solirubrobacter deserti]MDA0136672.1 GNAT family N-acetyltransferase [Solirubrobacter deserti]
MTIRRAAADDIEPALAVMSEAFGIELRAPTVHTLVASSPDGTLLVAEEDGVVVGTAASVTFGPSGWLGGITVAPSARGRGLGRALTEAAIDALGERETVLLLASTLGRPLYEKLGFEPEGLYRVFSSGAARPEKTVELRDVREEDREAVLALDRSATGEDRSLAVLASLEGAVATSDLSAVALRPPWGALPIVGDPAGATTLLASLIRPGLRVAVPEGNRAAVQLLQLLGREVEPVTRMRRGPALDWHPERVWGVFSLFFG